MSDDLDDLEDLALDVPCAYCEAPPGYWCVTRNSRRRAVFLHGARTSPIYSAYGLGYSEADKEFRRKWDEAWAKHAAATGLAG